MPDPGALRQALGRISVTAPRPGLCEITDRVGNWLSDTGPAAEGLLTLFCRHSSASLTVQENADPSVRVDLERAFAGLAPHGGAERYVHHAEGPDDMAAHIRTVLSGVHLAIPVMDGRLALGTWQGIYLWEHRDRPRPREIALHLLWEG